VGGEYGLYHGTVHGVHDVRDDPAARGVRGARDVLVDFQDLVRYGE
jgi:hypothetical protein